MLSKLKRRFWTDDLEMVKDINNELNPEWEVAHLDYEMLILESENGECTLHIVRAGNTVAIANMVLQ